MTVYKHLKGLRDASLSFTNLLLETICPTQITVRERKTHAVHKQASFPQRTSELSELISRLMDDYRNLPTIKFCAYVFPFPLSISLYKAFFFFLKKAEKQSIVPNAFLGFFKKWLQRECELIKA